MSWKDETVSIAIAHGKLTFLPRPQEGQELACGPRGSSQVGLGRLAWGPLLRSLELLTQHNSFWGFTLDLHWR